jgi:hypothetical protein
LSVPDGVKQQVRFQPPRGANRQVVNGGIPSRFTHFVVRGSIPGRVEDPTTQDDVARPTPSESTQRADETAPNQAQECLFVPQTPQWRTPRTLKLDDLFSFGRASKAEKPFLQKWSREAINCRLNAFRHLGAASVGSTEPNGSMQYCCLGAISIAQPRRYCCAKATTGL